MTIDTIKNQEYYSQNKAPVSVQNELAAEVFKESVGQGQTSYQKQILQILASAQPQQSVQDTFQKQMDQKGSFDIKI